MFSVCANTTSAARRARAATLSAESPPKRAPALRETRGAGLALEAAAGMLHHGRALKERGLSQAQCPRFAPGPTTTSATWRARPPSSVVRLLPRDSEHSAHTLRKSRGTGLALDAAAGTLHRGARADRERLSPVQYPYLAPEPTTTSATWRVHAPTSCGAPPPQRQRAQRACATQDTRHWLGVGGRSWHVAPRARAERERPLAGAMSLFIACTDHNHRGTARARTKSSSAAPPP